MYLALQHGIFVANYPLVEEDFETAELVVEHGNRESFEDVAAAICGTLTA